MRSITALLAVPILCSCGRPGPEPGLAAPPRDTKNADEIRRLARSIEDLEAEVAALRRELLARSPRADSAEAEPEWTSLVRDAEARLVVETVVRHRTRLLEAISRAEAEIAAGPRTEITRRLEDGEMVVESEIIVDIAVAETNRDNARRKLTALESVRSLDDLHRWRREFEVPPLD